jgi:hypothetical protein
MAETEQFTGLSDGEGVICLSGEEYPTSIARKRHDDLMKWVLAHEEQARNIICNWRQFTGEQFCAMDNRRDFELTFL